jgi:hypothetical protein
MELLKIETPDMAMLVWFTMYNNLRTYINPKGMIGMLVIGRHVWSHAYEHDKATMILSYE